ncbi:MAG: collagen-like protein, partial [Pseudomonadota bacterium]|nr:collagen-like protein [Pseudomonadota bacterium]
MLKRSIIALSLLTILSGCSLDGDDGKDGLKGEQGPAGQNGTNGTDGVNGTDGTNGTDGANGIDANAALTINLIGRAVLNAESPEGAAEIVAYQASKQR